MPEIVQSGCTEEANTGLTYDPRFSVSGMYTNVYDVQKGNGVLDILQGSPDYTDYVTDPES